MLNAINTYLRRLVRPKQDSGKDNQQDIDRLSLILKAGKLRLWFYYPATRHYAYFEKSGTAESHEYNPIEFSQFFNRDDFEVMRRYIFDLCEERRQSASFSLRSNKDNGEERHFDMHISVAGRDARGRVTRVLGIEHDVTDDYHRMQDANKLLMRYHTVFNTSLLDMVYYDKDGILRDINEKACQTFGVKERVKLLESRTRLSNNPMFNDVDPEQVEDMRTSALVDFAEFSAPEYRVDNFAQRGKMYYESTFNPIRTADGRLDGIYMAGRDITEMVESYHHQVASARKLQQAMSDIQEYINNINYALQVSDVRLVNYDPHTYTLELSNNINQRQMRMSQLRCIRIASPRFRRHVSSALNRMDHLTTSQIVLTIETEFRDKKRRPIWMMFNMVPMLDANGRVERYFGMCRDVTDIVETEQRLAVETQKAQEMELLKQSFLTNMSYEIRTPLNTVVGFAELFEQEHDPADEALFVNHIKESSSNLLLLINDILFLSRLDANMIEYNKTDTDFALVFESHCQMGWSNLSPDVRIVIENPYEHLVVSIDDAYVGRVIERLCYNAAVFCRKGVIRAKYEYRRGELSISIEDTGVGIDEQTLPHVFDRFVRNKDEEMCGTGLDLPIVQALVQQMGGSIEFQSQLGRGTTAWVAIPCDVKTIEKKADIITSTPSDYTSL